MADKDTLVQRTILKTLQTNDFLRIHVAYYPDVFALSCRGLITFRDSRDDNWVGFEVRLTEAAR